MTKTPLVIFVIALIILAVTLIIKLPIIYAEADYKTWKIFDDGVTYWYQDKGDAFTRNADMGILVDGKYIRCDNSMFMHGGILDPQCVEIILRHELDRRGL